jgi:membrane associated rhomboid family serine protease
MLKLRPVSILMPRWLTPVHILVASTVLALLLEFLLPNAGLSVSFAHLGGFIGSVALFVCAA